MNKLHYLISNRFLIYPKSTVAFFFVKSFFISLFLFPKLGDSYSARVDFVILFSGFVFLTFYRLKTFHFSRSPLRIYFILFFISVLSSFFGQIFTHDLIFEPRAFPYFMGQIRFIFVFYAVLILLSNSRYSDTEIYKLITILIILNSLITLFEFFNIFHMQTLINNIYHGDLFIERIESRAQGIFGRVHSAAYFTSVCFLFSLSMLIKYRSFFYFLSSAISFIAVIVTFSKGAILGLAFGVLFLLMKSSRNIVYILIFIISLFLLFLYFPRIEHMLNSFFSVYDFWVNDRETSQYAFVSARLDHGWFNALNNFYNNLFFGNLIFSFDNFVGDGGWTETASHGGISLLFGFIVLWFGIIRTGLINYNKDNLESAVFLTMVGIFSIVSMLATGIFLERNLELIAALLALSSYKITHLNNA